MRIVSKGLDKLTCYFLHKVNSSNFNLKTTLETDKFFLDLTLIIDNLQKNSEFVLFQTL